MLTSLISALVFSLAALPAQALHVPGGDAWVTDMNAARAQAREEGKDLLVDFTGSDWCSACVQLHKEVFSRSEFLEPVQEDFVLVELDFPEPGGPTYKSMPQALHAKNAAEQQAFGVNSFPSVFLMTADGVAYARTGYRQGGAKSYLRHLARLREGEARSVVAKQVEVFLSDDASDAARLEAAYSMLGRVVAAHVDAVYDTIRELDPEDSRGVIAPRMLEAFAREHLNSAPADWSVPQRALEALGERMASMQEQALYHYYDTIIALNLAQLARAEAGLAEMRRIGGVRKDLLGMLESWHARLSDEASASAATPANDGAPSEG
ncbi:MAG: hypothetical protein DHS20C15_01490 [Planctomycetota bacterium]|nr:MAG: hypothetical protein DHS20C15_01490 [Planctomycetota bacterium]